MSYYC